MSTDEKNIDPTNTIPLKLLVDEKKTRVLAAEATSDFVDVLLSFLTFPLGTAVRVTNKHPDSIGCMNNLYKSIEQLSTDDFCTEACKSILLNPRNTHALVCKNLKLNIDDTSNGKYFGCSYCVRKSHYPNTKCICERGIANIAKSEESQNLDTEHFVKRRTMWLITDDLQVLPANPISLVQLLCNLGFSDVDQVEELFVDVGLDEVSKLLNYSLVSKTPLTYAFLGKRRLANISIPDMYPRNSPSPSSNIQKLPNLAKFPVKLILSKSQDKIFGFSAMEDFIDCLFCFCTLSLGSIVKLLSKNSGLGCIDNLYRTVECLDSKWLAMSKDEIINAGVLKQYKCKNHPLQIPDAKDERNLLDPRSPTGCGNCFGRFVEAPKLFFVSDNLTVTPLSSLSSISLIKELNIPLNDIEEQEKTIGETEALALLKASLTSSSALNNCFKVSGIWKVKVRVMDFSHKCHVVEGIVGEQQRPLLIS